MTVLLSPTASAGANWNGRTWVYTPDPNPPVLQAYRSPVYQGCPTWALTSQDRTYAQQGYTQTQAATMQSPGYQILKMSMEYMGYATDIGSGYFEDRAVWRQIVQPPVATYYR